MPPNKMDATSADYCPTQRFEKLPQDEAVGKQERAVHRSVAAEAGPSYSCSTERGSTFFDEVQMPGYVGNRPRQFRSR